MQKNNKGIKMIEKSGKLGKFSVYKETDLVAVVNYTGDSSMAEPVIIVKFRDYFKLYLPKRLRARAMNGAI